MIENRVAYASDPLNPVTLSSPKPWIVSFRIFTNEEIVSFFCSRGCLFHVYGFLLYQHAFFFICLPAARLFIGNAWFVNIFNPGPSGPKESELTDLFYFILKGYSLFIFRLYSSVLLQPNKA